MTPRSTCAGCAGLFLLVYSTLSSLSLNAEARDSTNKKTPAHPAQPRSAAAAPGRIRPAWCLRVREHPCAPENLYESGMSQPGNAGRTPDRIIRHDVGAHGAENIGPGTLPAALLPDLGGLSSPGKKGISVIGREDAAACQSAPSVLSGGVVGPVGVGGGGKGKSRTNNHAPPSPAPRRAALTLDRLL